MANNPFKIYDDFLEKRGQVRPDVDFIDEEIVAETTDYKGFFGTILSKNKINFWIIFFAAVIFVIYIKLGYLQLYRGGYYFSLAEGNRVRVLEIKPDRGIIYDSEGKPLVKNEGNFLLAIIPVDLPKNENELLKLCGEVAEIINYDAREICETAAETNKISYQPVMIAENLTYDQAIKIKIESGNMPGIVLGIGTNRRYTETENVLSLSHILGYLSKITDEDFEAYKDEDYSLTDFLGRTGLEFSYEKILRGKKGMTKVEVDALGREKETLAWQNSEPGSDLILSIDLEIQKKLEESLKNSLVRFGKRRGAAVAIDPNTGEILGLVSLPTFDNNDFILGITPEKYQALIENKDRPLFNRVISGTYPSGSTIKPILAAAALQEGVVTSNTTFLSTGGLRVAEKWFFPDWKAGGHGRTNIYKALAESVNTYFYIIGGGYKDIEGLGLERIAEYFELAGIGQKLGVDLPNEAAGLLPTEDWKKIVKGEDWYIGDTYHLSIGQGDLLVTPLQVASFTAIVANGGTLYKPQLVTEVVNKTTGVNFKIQPTIIHKNIAEKNYLEAVRTGMRRVVTDGTAPQLYDLPIAVAGKTGTAEWSSKNEPHAWFTGFAPYDKPEIVVTFLIEEGGEGSTAAVPAAKEFFLWWAEYHENIKTLKH